MPVKSNFPLLAGAALALAGLACSAAVPAAPAAAPIEVTRVVVATAAPAASSVTVSSSEEQTLIALYQRVNPAVASIQVMTSQGGGAGSGWLFDADGHMVTNHHVVDGAQSIEVDFPSGLKTGAQVVGVDPDADLAVLKLDEVPAGVEPLPLADSSQIQVGQRAIAIGNPFEESGTMTLGIISSLGRVQDGNRTNADGSSFSNPDIIQTDAPINPGNSGGPLLNLSGEVIGVVRSIAIDPTSTSRVGSGVGFAIAANTVKQIVPYLIKDGKFVYPYLGIKSTSSLSLSLAKQLGLKEANGVYVTDVVAGGPADKAGLRADSATASAARFSGDGDLIVAVDGQPLHVFGDLMSYLINHTRPGQVVTLTVMRQGQQREVKLTLGERP